VGSLDELKSWSAAAVTARTGLLHRIMNGYRLAEYDGCGMCGQCEKACPLGIATSDVMRCIRYYHDSERLPHMAASEFRMMGLAAAAKKCNACGDCEAVCPKVWESSMISNAPYARWHDQGYHENTNL